MKNVLMIHQINDKIFNLPLDNYILTFDDGTEDHYRYYQKFKSINTFKKYFIITNRINTNGYLTVNQIKEMMQDSQVSFGGHSHNHIPLNNFNLKELYNHIIKDTEKMLNWFEINLNFIPTEFCFPYNYNPLGLYKEILKKYGILTCYGDERISVETLLQN